MAGIGSALLPTVLSPEASALVRLLESGLGVMQSQPDHPLAGQLAVAMRNAAHTLALTSQHLEA
jgi:hypothetical protein